VLPLKWVASAFILNIPSFHSDAKNSSQLKKLNVRWGKDFPRRLMTVLELFAKEVNFHG